MPGCELGAAVAFRRLFFLFGAGLGVTSGADASACETELEEKKSELDVPQSSSVFQAGPLLTHLGTSTRSSTAVKKPPVSVVSGEARRQCSAPGKVPRPRCGQEGRTGASLQRGNGTGF